MASFYQIGRLFYKGVSVTQTQSISQQIFSDINGNFQTAESVSSRTSTTGYRFYCIGNSRYTYNIDKQVNSDASPDHSGTNGNYGILKDVLSGNGCAPPCDDLSSSSCPAGSVKFNKPVELLGHNMRVEKFTIAPIANNVNLYAVSFIIAYGDATNLSYTTANDFSTVKCASSGQGQEFCAVNKVDTSVYLGRT